MHSRSVPVAANGLAMELQIHAVGLTEARHEIPGHPDVVGGSPRTFAEDLELPLSLGDLRIDSLMVDAGVRRHRSRCLSTMSRATSPTCVVTNPRVIFALRRRKSLCRESERAAVLVEEILLLETEPAVGVIDDRRARVGRMRTAIRPEHLRHHDGAVRLGRVWINSDRLENAIGGSALRLLRRTAVKPPVRNLLESQEAVEFLDQRLASNVGSGLVPVEPDVFQFVNFAILSLVGVYFCADPPASPRILLISLNLLVPFRRVGD